MDSKFIAMTISESNRINDIAITDKLARILLGLDGGEGSGNYGHAGNPGHVGGSAPKNAGRVRPRAREHRDKPENVKIVAFGGKPKDVTNEYRMKARPGKGKYTFEEGYSESRDGGEVKIAEWIVNTFGGNVLLLDRAKMYPNKCPDYKWRGKLWDLKTPDVNTKSAIERCLGETSKDQIKSNPGGVIIDLDKCKAKIQEAEKIITEKAERSFDFAFDVIILHSGRSYKVLRFDEKQKR